MTTSKSPSTESKGPVARAERSAEVVEAELSANLAESQDRGGAGGFAFLGAVHKLVNTTRATTKADLILAAVSQALRTGDKTDIEVETLVNRIWPGAATDLPSVKVALDLGAELGLLTSRQGLDGAALWTLTTRGVEDVDRHRAWVEAMRTKVRAELVERATRELNVTPHAATSELWFQALVSALIDGIQSSQDAYLGQVDEIMGRQLAPRVIDHGRVLARFENDRINPVTAEFLKATAVAALDPLDTFGNDLVSHITTGCVLHSFVAGRDASSILSRLGSPVGQRALIDTPTLIDLIGPARVRVHAVTTITAALESGWDVVVCEHSIDELIDVVTREIPKIKSAFAAAVKKGVRTEWYASLVEDQLSSYCVEVLRTGQYSKLEEMVDAAEQIRPVLETMGVVVRPHHNDQDAERVERCRGALERQLIARPRSSHVIQRDADSMALIWRRRRRESGSSWPGGWIITSDRHIGPAYSAMQPKDPVSLTLSMAQWNTLLAVTVPPADVVTLASAAANQLVEEAMWLLPARFPSEVAMDLARQISAEGDGTELDLRVAQLTLDDALDAAGHARTATSLASDVLAARDRRTTTLNNLQVAQAFAAQHASERTAMEAAVRADVEAKRALDAQLRERDANTRAAALEEDLAWEKSRARRLVVVAVLMVFGVGLTVAAALLAWPPFAWICIIGGLAGMTLASYRWLTNQESKFLPILLAAAVETVGLASGLLSFLPEN